MRTGKLDAPTAAATAALSNTVASDPAALFADKTALAAIRIRAAEQTQAHARAQAETRRERAARQRRHQPAPTIS